MKITLLLVREGWLPLLGALQAIDHVWRLFGNRGYRECSVVNHPHGKIMAKGV